MHKTGFIHCRYSSKCGYFQCVRRIKSFFDHLSEECTRACSYTGADRLSVCMWLLSIPVGLTTFSSPPSLFPLPPPASSHTLKQPNHPASTGMWTQCSVHLFLSPLSSLSLALPLCLLYFHLCFHSPSFRVITWHLHCKVPCAALSSSAGDWASFPKQIRERKRKRERKGGLQQGVLFWLAVYRNNALNSLLLVDWLVQCIHKDALSSRT